MLFFFSAQERSQCEGLLRLELLGRLRARDRVRDAVRPLPRGFRRRGIAKASQALCWLVLQVPREKWVPCGGERDRQRRITRSAMTCLLFRLAGGIQFSFSKVWLVSCTRTK
jgi:hypothetical protein